MTLWQRARQGMSQTSWNLHSQGERKAVCTNWLLLLLLQILVVPTPYSVGSCSLIWQAVPLGCKNPLIALLRPTQRSVLGLTCTEPGAFTLKQKGEKSTSVTATTPTHRTLTHSRLFVTSWSHWNSHESRVINSNFLTKLFKMKYPFLCSSNQLFPTSSLAFILLLLLFMYPWWTTMSES